MAWTGSAWRPVFVHAVRTALAAVVSFLVARVFGLPEAYWAPITTLVITQSSLGTALPVSWNRLIGTALGALVGALVASYLPPTVLVYGVSIFMLGLFCAVVRSNRSAYRLGAVALTIVLLIPHADAAWRVAWHRFAEVAIGIVVALVLTVVWPDAEAAAGVEK